MRVKPVTHISVLTPYEVLLLNFPSAIGVILCILAPQETLSTYYNMANQMIPDEERVYIQYFALFQGNNAQIRKQKKIEDVLKGYHGALGTLTNDFSRRSIATIVKRLLEAQIFRSVSNASLRFPELFQQPRAFVPIPPLLQASRLDPIYLPYRIQHIILSRVQKLLEQCCFDFGHKWAPDKMQECYWYEVESVELTEFTRIFVQHVKSLHPSAIKPTAGKTMAKVFWDTSDIRHAAVHRINKNVPEMLQMLFAAWRLAVALKDDEIASKVAEIFMEVNTHHNDLLQAQMLPVPAFQPGARSAI